MFCSARPLWYNRGSRPGHAAGRRRGSILKKRVLAFDLGASSGRLIEGAFDGERLTLRELHRFPNEPVRLGATLYWDFPRLMHEIKIGLVRAGRGYDSMGVDTWGADAGFLDRTGNLLTLPVHYRDARYHGIREEVAAVVPPEELYARTGIQSLDFNTLNQLYYAKTRTPGLLEQARQLLFIPDLINYFLTGTVAVEYTDASTSQLLDARRRDWDRALIARLGFPDALFTPLVASGTPLGTLSRLVTDELGIAPLRVIAAPGHDTASAVLAAPLNPTENPAYLSSGTWSLLGLELPEPILTPEARAEDFSNEGGVGHTIRFLKNISGLWLMQETRRRWAREGGALSFADIDRMTAQAQPLRYLFDPDAPGLSSPGDVPGRIASLIRQTYGETPAARGEISRAIGNSLAMAYRYYIERLEALTGRRIGVLHIVGGGVQDRFICRATANAAGRPVVAGPVEATALGNIACQLIALGCLRDAAEARDCIRRSFPAETYEPQDGGLWDAAYERFLTIRGVSSSETAQFER